MFIEQPKMFLFIYTLLYSNTCISMHLIQILRWLSSIYGHEEGVLKIIALHLSES